METLSLGCVLLAAGNASRFGENKLLCSFQGKPLIRLALEAVPSAKLQQTVVVTQYPEIAQAARSFGFTVLRNHQPELGISHSLKLGLQALAHMDAVLFMVADQPLLRPDSVEALLTFYQKNPGNIVAMSHQGRRGNPCLFPREFFPALLSLQGDQGGSQVIRQHEDRLLLWETDGLQLADVDTLQELESLNLTNKGTLP